MWFLSGLRTGGPRNAVAWTGFGAGALHPGGLFADAASGNTSGPQGSAARFALDLEIATEEEGLAVNAAGDTTRFNLTGRVGYVLRDTTTGTVVTSGKVENFTAYSAIGTTVATLAAERDAVERLMVILGDQITARLYALDLPA